MNLMNKVIEPSFVSRDEIDEDLNCPLWITQICCSVAELAIDRNEKRRRRTFFGEFDSLDEIVDESLQIVERVGDVGSFVDLGERFVEDGDDIFQ